MYWEESVSVRLGNGNDGSSFFIYPDGGVFWSRQARLSLRCNMGFGQLPFDSQHCLFLAGIYSDIAENINLAWDDPASPLGGYLLRTASVGGEWSISDIHAGNVLEVFSTGNYSYAKACITFARESKQNTLKMILAMIFVLMSYMGFWISPGTHTRHAPLSSEEACALKRRPLAHTARQLSGLPRRVCATQLRLRAGSASR